MEENSSLRKELDELVIASTDPLKLKALERDDSIEQTEMPGKSVSSVTLFLFLFILG